MTHRIQIEQQLHCDIKTAWDFFSSPHNLSKITPKAFGFTVLNDIEPEIYEGMEIYYVVSPLLGIPIKWKTIITRVDHQKSFTDYQAKGPYKSWNHFHEFIPNNEGVLMRDTVDYEMPFGFLGSLMRRLVVKSKLATMFDYRKEVLENMFNGTPIK